jgi:hypothetical protein
MSDWNDNKFVATISDSDSADGAIIRLIYFDGDDICAGLKVMAVCLQVIGC